MNLRKPLAGLILMLAAAGLVAAQLPQSVYFKDSAPPAGACTPGSEGIVHLNSATSQWYVCESGSWVAKTIDPSGVRPPPAPNPAAATSPGRGRLGLAGALHPRPRACGLTRPASSNATRLRLAP